MWSIARKVVAVALMAGSAGRLVALISGSRFGTDEAGLVAVAVVLVVGTVALAIGAWWARLLALAWGGSAAIMAGVALASDVPSMLPYLVGALVLLGCLAGKAMFDRYEGTAPPPIDWTQPGMGVVRAAVVTNLCGFLGGVAFAPALFAFQSGRGYLHQPTHSPDPTALLAIGLTLAATMLVGVVLLAKQRTAGLLVVVLAAVGLPLALISNPGALDGGAAPVFAGLFGPGILCGWIALGRYLPRMIRFLRV